MQWLLTGQMPFDKDNLMSYVAGIVKGERREYAGPAVVANLLTAGLISQPEERMSLDEFRRRLQGGEW